MTNKELPGTTDRINVSSETVHQIIEDFRHRRWDKCPLERAGDIVQAEPEQTSKLVRMILAEMPEGGTLLDGALSFLLLTEYPSLVTEALIEFTRNPQNEAAGSIITYASLQCVSVLHPYLETIFNLAVNEGLYYVSWPWRETGSSALSFLRGIIEDEARDEDARWRAWFALLETRDNDCLRYALTSASKIPVCQAATNYLAEVGLELYGGRFQPLYPTNTFHLSFQDGYFDDAARPSWLRTTAHPTWALPATTAAPLRFGGITDAETRCAACGGLLHHLITLAAVPAGLGVTSMQSLTLATCLSCLGYEVEALFYQHDMTGRPTSFACGEIR